MLKLELRSESQHAKKFDYHGARLSKRPMKDTMYFFKDKDRIIAVRHGRTGYKVSNP